MSLKNMISRQFVQLSKYSCYKEDIQSSFWETIFTIDLQ